MFGVFVQVPEIKQEGLESIGEGIPVEQHALVLLEELPILSEEFQLNAADIEGLDGEISRLFPQQFEDFPVDVHHVVAGSPV